MEVTNRLKELDLKECLKIYGQKFMTFTGGRDQDLYRLFRHDLNQIPYDNRVEMTNRFKGLDLIDRVPEELWMDVRDIVQGGRDQDHSQDKEMQKGKMVV